MRLGSEVKHWRRVISLIDCAAGLVHGMCGADSDTPLENALQYYRRPLEVLHAMLCVLREVLFAGESMEEHLMCW